MGHCAAHIMAAFRALRSARAADRDAVRLVFSTCSSLTRDCRLPILALAVMNAASRLAAFPETLKFYSPVSWVNDFMHIRAAADVDLLVVCISQARSLQAAGLSQRRQSRWLLSMNSCKVQRAVHSLHVLLEWPKLMASVIAGM